VPQREKSPVNDQHRPLVQPLATAPGPDLSALRLHPSRAANGSPVYLFAYRGSSMHPTFSERDLLEILPCDLHALRVGDVIALLPPDGEHLVVHRVVEVAPAGLRTAGDNNRSADEWLLQSQHIVGQVVAVWRGDRRRGVPRAGEARRRGRVARWLGQLDRIVSPLLHPLYHALARSGVVQRLTPRSLRPRAVLFRTTEHRWLRLLLGRRVIGHYDPRTDHWHIRRPFRILIDEETLPRPVSTTPRGKEPPTWSSTGRC
jgi:hypothetical protein